MNCDGQIPDICCVFQFYNPTKFLSFLNLNVLPLLYCQVMGIHCAGLFHHF